jgi:hypothetical protein
MKRAFRTDPGKNFSVFLRTIWFCPVANLYVSEPPEAVETLAAGRFA